MSKKREAAPAAMPFVVPRRMLSYRIAALQQQGKRPYQEDDLLMVNEADVTLIREQGLLFAVADGMGGMAGGKEASAAVVSSLKADAAKLVPSRPAGPQLAQMALRANDQVYSRLGGKGGSTLVAGFIFNEKFSWVSVGDSFIFLKRGDGIYRVNQDMTVRIRRYREALANQSVDRTGGDEDRESACVATFVGMGEMNAEPEYSRQALVLRDGDELLVCSDGVAGVLTDEELLGAMQSGTSQQICRSLCQLVESKHRKNQDNYTAIVVQCCY